MPIQPTSSKTEYVISDTELKNIVAAAIGISLEELEITFVQTKLELEPNRQFGNMLFRTEARVVCDHLKKDKKLAIYPKA